nr:MAG TPA: hypothetical protein [Caudoviricetes sp.]
MTPFLRPDSILIYKPLYFQYGHKYRISNIQGWIKLC